MIRVCRSIGVQYALEGVAALRLGEAVGLRWRPYDTAKEPFRQLLLATSYNKGGRKPLIGSGAAVPVPFGFGPLTTIHSAVKTA